MILSSTPILVVHGEAGIDQFGHVTVICRLVGRSSREVDALGSEEDVAHVVLHVAMNFGGEVIDVTLTYLTSL